MREDQNLILGMDLCNEWTQISYFNTRTFEVEKIALDPQSKEDAKSNVVETILAVSREGTDLVIGNQAREKEEEGYILVEDILLPNRDSIVIMETEVSMEQILARFLRKLLILAKREFPNQNIKKIVVTMEHLNFTILKRVYGAFSSLGIQRDRVHVISHEQSFIYFALSQKKELWMNDVVLFEYNSKGLYYHKINIDRRNRPMLVVSETKDFTEAFSKDTVVQSAEDFSYLFDTLAESAMHKQIISTVYLTGPLFEEAWMQQSLHRLCAGKRVFVGQNLYCYGAAYAAREEVAPSKFTEFALLSKESIPVAVGMQLYTKGSNREMSLLQAATPWYEVDYVYHMIVDEEEELKLNIYNLLKKTTTARMLSLDGIGARTNRMTRIELRLRCTNQNTLVVTMKDLGFGEFVLASHRIVETVIGI